MLWMDSMGGPASTFRGTFVGKVMSLTSQGEQGHARCTFEFPKKDSYVFTMEVSPDGTQWIPFMTGKYKKKE